MNERVALITGASRGIGQAVALGLAEDGYHVGLIARSDLEATAAGARNSGVRAYPYRVAVEDESAVQSAVSDLVKREGRIDVLFNNAGLWVQGSAELPPTEFSRVIAVNLEGAFHVLHSVVPVMKKQRFGTILNLASICGVHGFSGIGAYTASKFGLVGLGESLFRELVPLGIKVTTICPSWVNTAMASHASFPREEMIQPADLLRTVRFLAGMSAGACVRELVIDCARDIV